MPPRKGTVPPSPARSRRGASTVRGGEDDGDNDSITSTSFKVPASRSKANTSATLGLVDTSVNVAAAFHAARNGHGHLMPFASVDHSFASSTSSRKPPSKTQSARGGSVRAQSPAESLASAARALSPVRYFLKSQEDENGDFDTSGGGYPSFSSLGNGSGSFEQLGEISYDYQQEERFVQEAQAKAAKTRGPRVSDPKKRRGKALAEDLPYRPAEDDEIYNSEDSGGEGEGIVKNGALEGRASTRGVRQEKGEGYLGMGLGIQPRQRRKTRKGDEGGMYDEGSEGEESEMRSQRAWTPALELPNGHRRSPTPVQLLRALSPRVDRRSPAPTFHPRKRRPSNIRTIVTNLLHGLVLGLRFAVDSVTNLLHSILLRPGHTIAGSGRGFLKRVKSDWWKWFGGLIALGLAVRILDAPWRSQGTYRIPDAPPASIEEVAARLSNLEHFTSELSQMLKELNQGESEHQTRSQALLGRMDDLENAVMVEKKRVESLRGQGDQGVRVLQQSFDSLKAELDGLTSRVGHSESAVTSAQDKLKSVDDLDREVDSLKFRVGQVEKQVSDALDDGRLRAALERILPDALPVKINPQGMIDVDPRFWTEMKKVMMERTETEALIKKALASLPASPLASKDKKNDKAEMEEGKIRAWAEDVFERQSSAKDWVTRESFQDVLNQELRALRAELSSIKEHRARERASSSKASPLPAASSVTIKSGKGEDLTSLFNDLIDAALLRYSKDTIARTDFALFTAGARVIPHLTSDTLVLSTASKLGRWVMGSKDVQGRPPATALHPDISVGSCWPFQGSEGSLGVMLTRRVRVGDVTIEHAPSDLALDTSTAPKSIQVMGVLDNEEDRSKLAQYWERRGDAEPTPDYLPLGTITYDPSSISHIQTFPVPSDIQELDIKVGVVVFKVESNYGGSFTCLYRVRVHGDAEESA
ncbi:hypothetical protein I317_04873 [Kwoniella heveanensis CBS 569]|nr:hypothetical protein I317_04873 [Kwoniella heveanensis CBS 569]